MAKFRFIPQMDARAVSACKAFGRHPAGIAFGFGLVALGAGALGNYWPLQTLATSIFIMAVAFQYFARLPGARL